MRISSRTRWKKSRHGWVRGFCTIRSEGYQSLRGPVIQRQSRTWPVMTSPRLPSAHARLAVEVQEEISRKSSLAKAIAYLLTHWDGLCVFLEDGRVEVDTNAVEREVKPVALGRRNSLFAGSSEGGETWAVLSTLINSAKLNGVDPLPWLTDVLDAVVTRRVTINEIHRLTPWAWAAERQAELARAA